ncbi:MAG: hypothetical protein Q8M16_15380 [Pirellulaceae bacterium]|nr:hypothetical protein [Pirellulaceae bacterium]
MKPFQEAGEVLAGRSDIHKSIRNILDNYCFVGSVDVAAYATENRWAAMMATRETPLAATPVLVVEIGAFVSTEFRNAFLMGS